MDIFHNKYGSIFTEFESIDLGYTLFIDPYYIQIMEKYQVQSFYSFILQTYPLLLPLHIPPLLPVKNNANKNSDTKSMNYNLKYNSVGDQF